MQEQWRAFGDPALPGWIDPTVPLEPAPPPRPLEVASTQARITAVVLDFVFLKVLTSLALLPLTAVGMLVALGGGDRVAVAATAAALTLNLLIAIGYFLWLPTRRGGATPGRRLAGIAPRQANGEPLAARRVIRHDAVLFVVPCVLLDPISVVGPRDLAVVVAWCAFQAVRDAGGATRLERALGFRMYVAR